LALTLFALPAAAEAQRVVNHQLRPDSPVPELCLTYDQKLSDLQRTQAAGALRLQKEGKEVALYANQLIAVGDQLCLRSLKPAASYRLELTKPFAPFTLDFVFPERTPELALKVADVPDAALSVLPAAQLADRLSVASVNVPKVRLQLYQVKERKDWFAAYRQQRQATRTPTEGLTLARERGELVWEQVVMPEALRNAPQQTPVPLPTTLSEGLYFLTASPEITGAARSFANPQLLRGRWLGVGRVQLAAVNGPQALLVSAYQSDGTPLAQVVTLQVLDDNGAVITETVSGPDGKATVQWRDDWRQRAAFVALNDAAAGPAILALHDLVALAPPPLPRQIFAAKENFIAGEQAIFTLVATDYRNRPVPTEAGWLRLYRPDWSLAGQQPVPAGKTGPFFVRLDVPTRGEPGAWHVEWQTSNGQKLAQIATHVQATAQAVSLTVVKPAAALGGNGDITLGLMARDAKGQPSPWQRGTVRWRPADLRQTAWPDYQIGSTSDSAMWRPLNVFLTDATGAARLALRVPLQDEPQPLQAVELQVTLDNDLDIEKLVLPVAETGLRIGVRAKASPDIDQAAFDIIALDAQGQRQAADGLQYHVYERGRKFSWYQESGHWGYRPLPNLRRIGGGLLSIPANAPASIQWPVISGNYTLDITDRSGITLARYDFTGGTTAEDLPKLKPVPPLWTVGKSQTLTLDMPMSGWISLVVQDELIRTVVTQYCSKGVNDIVLTPTPEWGRVVRISALATLGNSEQRTIGDWTQAIDPEQPKLDTQIKLPALLQSGRNIEVAVTVPNEIEWLSLLLAPYDDNGSLSPVMIDAVKPDGKAFIFRPYLPDFVGTLGVQVMGWGPNGWLRQTQQVTVKPALKITGELPKRLQSGDAIATTLALTGSNLPKGTYHYAITGGPGLAIASTASGKLELGGGRSANLFLKLRAPASGVNYLDLQVTGPKDLRFQRRWTMRVMPSATIADDINFSIKAYQTQTEKVAEALSHPRHYLVGPVPLSGVVPALEQFVYSLPVGAGELAAWLSTVSQWREIIIALELADALTLDQLSATNRRALQALQNSDGGIAVDGFVTISDLTSTALGVSELPGESLGLSMGLAWLQGQLNNSWQIDQNIEARARGFAVMAQYGRADIAALRYFVSGLIDKDVSALTAAAVALTFDKLQDQEAAQLWLQKSLAILAKTAAVPSQYWLVWQLLVQHSQVLVTSEQPNLSQHGFADLPLAIQAARLQTILGFAHKNPAWTITLDGEAKTMLALQRVTLAAGRRELSLANTGEQTLYGTALSGQFNKTSPSQKSYRADFYRLDGTLVANGTGLARGEDYVLMLSVPKAARFVTLPQFGGIGFNAVKAYESALLRSVLPALPLLSSSVVSVQPQAANWRMNDTQSDSARVAVLVKPVIAGSYSLPALTVRDDQGTATSIMPASKSRIAVY
jgi:uncharacterized protein YfaS (alpha-2-macroglobulin family)